MIQLLIGKKGTGKTKVLLENVNKAAEVAHGNVVFISNDTSRNMYDIKTEIRMADTKDFNIASWDEFLGFICGIISGNYDITNIFVDGVLKIVDNTMDGFEEFLNSLEKISEKFNIKFEISVSIDEADAPEYIKKYI